MAILKDDRRNYIINGNFNFWQRGTSLSASASNRFLADRWNTFGLGGTTLAPSRQTFSEGQTDVPNGPEYFHRTVVSSNTDPSSAAVIEHKIEDVRSLAEKTATMSFWAKADSTKPIAVEFVQSFGSGGSAEVNTLGVKKVTLTTSWQKFEFPVTFPSISGKTIASNESRVRVLIFLEAGSNFDSRTDNLGQQSGTFDIAQVMMNDGLTAAPFKMAGETLAGELQLCQRYYEVGVMFRDGYHSSNSNSINYAHFQVTKRATPSIVNTPISQSGYTTTVLSVFVSDKGFGCGRTKDGTTGNGNWRNSWTADAEL